MKSNVVSYATWVRPLRVSNVAKSLGLGALAGVIVWIVLVKSALASSMHAAVVVLLCIN
ncbi:MAG: hypothetical protein M1368_03805 [Thaumarchaeota archaeon]|nr:hypothetical protein [Nitrososphaerota archaeon]